MAAEILSSEYKQCSDILKNQSPNGPTAKLRSVLGPAGPERANAADLAQLRLLLLKSDEAANIFKAAGLDPDTKAVPDEKSVKLAGSLKFLRHLYMVSERGNQQVWVLSIPKSYTHYPLRELLAVKSRTALIKGKLSENDELFNEETRTRIGEAMMLGLSWCEAAKFTLSTIRSNAKSMAIARHWFADVSMTDTAFDDVVSKLMLGFKKMTNTLNAHQLIITDMPSLRNDPDYDLFEGFIVSFGPNEVEMPRTIYIEKALHENFELSVLHDMKKNWARALVHECSHIDARTTDYGYAFRGIQPGVDMPPGFAGNNADSWAFFAADCAGALTDGDRIRAFGGTGGRMVKLEKNWN